MDISEAINTALRTVPKALSAGLIDMESGLLLDIKTTASHPSEVLDLVAASTKDLFEGDNVTEIENLFKRTRGVESTERYFKEIIIYSTNLIHYFMRVPSREETVLCVVTQADANIGLVLLKSREIAKKVEI